VFRTANPLEDLIRIQLTEATTGAPHPRAKVHVIEWEVHHPEDSWTFELQCRGTLLGILFEDIEQNIEGREIVIWDWHSGTILTVSARPLPDVQQVVR
jgi:hypothetical protein